MYTPSEELINGFRSGERQIINIYTKEGIPRIFLSEENIIEGGLSIDRYCVSGDNVEMGSAIAAELTMKLNNTDGSLNLSLIHI